MRRTFLLAPLALLAACQTYDRPYAPVDNVRYQAMGWNPMWLLAIGDDRIVLRVGEGDERIWPRVLPRTVDGIRRWQSGSGAEEITIAAQPGPCQTPVQAESRYVYNYEHHVAVSVGDESIELRGCGGRMLERIERR